MDVSLKAKKILITGGTSTLGSAFIRKALKEKAEVFFTFHQDLKETENLKALGAKAFKLDLSEPNQIRNFVSEFKSHSNDLDGLIHNAAITHDQTIQNLTEEEWDLVLSVNLKSIYLLTKEMLRFLLKSKQAKVLNIVSRVGLQGGFGQANYAASKGGVIALTKSLAKELGSRKILVNALNPGFMESKMTRGLAPDIRERNILKSMIHEISEPSEVADFMVYLMSDYVTRVSGQIFHFESRMT